jgi:hypothetical protein
MRSKRIAVLFLAAVTAGPALAGKAFAAADQTLGMAILSAFVLDGGTLIRGAGALSATYDGSGKHTVKFNRPLAGCVATASSSFGGVIASSLVDEGGDTVRVDIYSHAGNTGEASFQVIVFCPR